MKLVMEDSKIIIFLNKSYVYMDDFHDKKYTEEFLKEVISKISKRCDLEFGGYYNVILYIDKVYGTVISIEKEDLEYFDCFNSIDMNIKIVETSFIYKMLEKVNDDLLEKMKVYKFSDVFYLEPNNNITDIEMGLLLENVEIVFNPSVRNMIKKYEILKG